jgi:hypothetical protein
LVRIKESSGILPLYPTGRAVLVVAVAFREPEPLAVVVGVEERVESAALEVLARAEPVALVLAVAQRAGLARRR